MSVFADCGHGIVGTDHTENMEVQSIWSMHDHFSIGTQTRAEGGRWTLRMCPTDLETDCSVNTVRARTGSNAVL